MHKVMHNILKILTPCHILSHIQNLGPGPAPSRSEHQMASPSTNSCNSIEIWPVGGSITEMHHLQRPGCPLVWVHHFALRIACVLILRQEMIHVWMLGVSNHFSTFTSTWTSYTNNWMTTLQKVIYIYMDLGCLIKVSTNIYQLYSH